MPRNRSFDHQIPGISEIRRSIGFEAQSSSGALEDLKLASIGLQDGFRARQFHRLQPGRRLRHFHRHHMRVGLQHAGRRQRVGPSGISGAVDRVFDLGEHVVVTRTPHKPKVFELAMMKE